MCRRRGRGRGGRPLRVRVRSVRLSGSGGNTEPAARRRAATPSPCLSRSPLPGPHGDTAARSTTVTPGIEFATKNQYRRDCEKSATSRSSGATTVTCQCQNTRHGDDCRAWMSRCPGHGGASHVAPVTVVQDSHHQTAGPSR